MPRAYYYPIIGLDRFGEFRFFRAPGDLDCCDAATLRSGAWKGMRLLDSRGQGRRIVGVTPKGVVGGWWGRLLSGLGANVSHWLQLDIADEASLTLAGAKAQVAARCEALGAELAGDLPARKARIARLQTAILAAATVEEIETNLIRAMDAIEADARRA